MMLSGLLKGGPDDALRALRGVPATARLPPHDLPSVLPRLAAALWMHRPDAFYA
jgi:hypothetical protein